MGDTERGSANAARTTRGWRPVSPLGLLASAAGVGLGVLTPIYIATNTDLSGSRFLLSILLAAVAVLLIVEGVSRARAAKQWRTVVGAGVAIELVSLALVLVPTSNGDTLPSDGGLRFSLRPTAPELFHVVFHEPIPWPSAEDDWAELHRRGGIDVGDSHFNLILANESSTPISVLSIRAEVVGSEPMPRGTDTWRYSQGEEGVGKLVTLLPNAQRGSIGRMYENTGQVFGRESLSKRSPYFQSKYILLKPGEVYPATLTVLADTRRTISYRLTAEGESANHHFVAHSPVYQLVGRFEDPYQRLFAHYYVKGHDPKVCTPTPENPWIDARNGDRFSACPHGLGVPYEVAPPSASRFPPGDLSLSLGLTPGEQSAKVDDVLVGAVPAAASRPDVVKPLLGSLGAWDRCSVYSPDTRYWTATWERWELRLVFDSEDEGDCTPSSHAGLRQLSLYESRMTVSTDLGPIDLGSSAQLPPAISRVTGAGEMLESERLLVVQGVSPCDPTSPDLSRYQIGAEVPGGIVTLRESLISGKVDYLTTTLPARGC
jgi:hypothetical protein